MGNGCSGKTTTVKPEPVVERNAEPSSPPVIPYIIVSSVSLSRKIAEENMQLSVKKLPKKPTKSAPASVRRRRRHSFKPLPMQETILFEDQNRCRKMSVPMENMGDIPFLSLNISDDGVDSGAKKLPKRRTQSLPTSINDTMSVDLGSVLQNHSPKRPGSTSQISGYKGQIADNSQLDYQCIETVDQANKAKSELPNENPSRLDGWVSNESLTPLESQQLTKITELANSNGTGLVDSGEMTHRLSQLTEEKEDLWTLPAHPVRPGSNLNTFQSPDTELNIQDMDKKMLKHTIANEAAVDVVDNIDGIRSYKDIKHYVT